MPSLKEYETMVRRIAEKNKWSKTANVTLLESVKKIINVTDKWRRKHPSKEVVQEILESVFFLLATCTQLNHNLDLDETFTQLCKSKESFRFDGVPDDLVWSFILFETEPHVDYSQRREPAAM